MNKHHLTLWFTAATLSVGQALAQEPPGPPPQANQPAAPPPAVAPVPPTAPHPPAPPKHGGRHDEAATYLGVAVAPVPDWLGEQLSLPNGFGLLVDYVIPGSPAELAGLKEHDIIKQLNDQMLANPEQLSALVQSFPDGQDVALTVLRKGQDTKLTAKLRRGNAEEAEGRGHRREDRRREREDRDRAREDRDRDRDHERMFQGPPADEILEQIRPAIRDLKRNAQREAADQIRRQITIMRDKRDGETSRTQMDLSKGRILIRDDKGEVELNGGKNGAVVAKDPSGKVIYQGDIKDAPPEVLERFKQFGENGKSEVKGGGFSFDSDDEDDSDAKKPAAPPVPAAPQPSTAPVPAPSTPPGV